MNAPLKDAPLKDAPLKDAPLNALPPVLPATVQRRITATLFASQSLFSAATIAAFTLTPVIAAQLGGSDALTGVPNTMLMLGRAGAGYPLGWLMDKISRRAGLSAGLFLAVVGMLVSAAAIGLGSFVIFLLGAALLGAGRSASEQSRFVAAEVYRPERRAKVIGLIVFAGTIGAVGGPLLVAPATAFAQSFGFAQSMGPFWVGAVLLAVALLLLVTTLRPDPKQLAAQVEEETGAPPAELPGPGQPPQPARTRRAMRPLREIFRSADVQLAVAAMVIGQLVMTLLMVIAPLHMSYASHTTQAISWVIMAHTLGMFGLSGVSGWLTDRLGRVPMILAGSLVQILAALLLPLSVEMPVLVASLFFLGLGWNFSFIAGSSLLSEALEPQERGRIQGINETLVALASGIGSLGTGGAFFIGGIGAVAAIGLMFSLLLGGLALWLGRARLFVRVAG